MRIIGGTKGGIHFNAPKNLPVRPITDRSKESLFNILENRFEFDKIIAMDLFSGTGCISYELASRGCKKVIAIDKNFFCTQFIKEQSAKLGFENEIEVIRMDALSYLKIEKTKFDFIFSDPPYKFKHYIKMIDLIFSEELLNKNGVFVTEHHSVNVFDKHPHFVEKRAYGQNVLSFFS